ncbi:MAG: hypothetical protein QXJ09_07900, partial [Candidatus Caldarchaeum sp.]
CRPYVDPLSQPLLNSLIDGYKPPGLTHGIEDPPQPMNPLPNTLPRGIPLRHIPKAKPSQEQQGSISLLRRTIVMEPEEPRHTTNDIIEDMHEWESYTSGHRPFPFPKDLSKS